MLKIGLKFILQKLLGFDNYLFLFSFFTISRIKFNLYEKGLLFFAGMIPENGNVLDIGANIGITSVPLAKRVCHGKVFSFEPIPQNLKALKRIKEYYHIPNIEIFEMALGEKQGELTMVLPVIHNVQFQGFSHVVEGNTAKEKGKLFSVPVERLDDLQDLQMLPEINAIKIDVENFEYHVLLGAEKLLKRHKPIIYCELWDNEKRMLTMNLLQEHFGYRVMVLENNQLVDFADHQALDFFFV